MNKVTDFFAAPGNRDKKSPVLVKQQTFDVWDTLDKREPGEAKELARRQELVHVNFLHLVVQYLNEKYHRYGAGFSISLAIGCSPENVRKILSRKRYPDPHGLMIKIRDYLTELIDSGDLYEEVKDSLDF